MRAKLPLSNGESYTCSQGNNGTNSYAGVFKNAFNFAMSNNTNVSTAQAGAISPFKQSYVDYKQFNTQTK